MLVLITSNSVLFMIAFFDLTGGGKGPRSRHALNGLLAARSVADIAFQPKDDCIINVLLTGIRCDCMLGVLGLFVRRMIYCKLRSLSHSRSPRFSEHIFAAQTPSANVCHLCNADGSCMLVLILRPAVQNETKQELSGGLLSEPALPRPSLIRSLSYLYNHVKPQPCPAA